MNNNDDNDGISGHLIIRSQDVVSSVFDEDEVVLMRISDTAFFNLEGHVAALWNLMDQTVTLDGLVTELMRRFEVSKEQCEADCRAALGELKAAGLIEIIERPLEGTN